MKILKQKNNQHSEQQYLQFNYIFLKQTKHKCKHNFYMIKTITILLFMLSISQGYSYNINLLQNMKISDSKKNQTYLPYFGTKPLIIIYTDYEARSYAEPLGKLSNIYKSTFLLDAKHSIKQKWKLGDCNNKSTILIIGKDKKIKYFKKLTSRRQCLQTISEFKSVLAREINVPLPKK